MAPSDSTTVIQASEISSGQVQSTGPSSSASAAMPTTRAESVNCSALPPASGMLPR